MEHKKHPIDLAVGRNMRAARLRAQMNLAEIAKKLNLSYQQVQKYETADCRISASKLYEFAKTVHCTIGDLYHGIDPRHYRIEFGNNQTGLIAADNLVEARELAAAMAKRHNHTRFNIIELGDK